jgi:hypothetical protein
MSGQEDGQRRFADRLSPLIAAAGVVPVPVLLIRHQARLGLTAPELVYLLHVLSHRWDGGEWPWVAVASVCEATGASERSVQEWKASLQRKHLLRCKPRYLEGIGRRADEHDLSGLFAALEALVLEDETRKALESVRADLPRPTYHQGLGTTPQLPAGRPAIARTTAVRKSAPPPRDHSHPAGVTDRTPPVRHLAPEEEPSTRVRPQTERPLEPPPEQTAQTGRAMAAARPVRTQDTPTPETSGGDEGETGWYDEGIVLYIEQYAAQFGDNDPARSVDVAHHLWWHAGVSRSAMHNAMKKAYYATRRVQEAGQIRGTAMAYYFALLKAAIDDERVRAQRAG